MLGGVVGRINPVCTAIQPRQPLSFLCDRTFESADCAIYSDIKLTRAKCPKFEMETDSRRIAKTVLRLNSGVVFIFLPYLPG